MPFLSSVSPSTRCIAQDESPAHCRFINDFRTNSSSEFGCTLEALMKRPFPSIGWFLLSIQLIATRRTSWSRLRQHRFTSEPIPPSEFGCTLQSFRVCYLDMRLVSELRFVIAVQPLFTQVQRLLLSALVVLSLIFSQHSVDAACISCGDSSQHPLGHRTQWWLSWAFFGG
jgi:hypothetical protein